MDSWLVDTADQLALDQLTEVRVHMVKGNLRIAVGAQPSVAVSGVRGRPVRVRLDDGELTIGYDRRVRRLPVPFIRLALLRRDHADLTVTAPPNCPIVVTTVDATVTVSDVTASVIVDSVCGDVNLVGVAGPARVVTGRGLVQALGVTGDLDIDIHAGDLRLIHGRSSQVKARSIHGSHLIDMTTGAGVRVDVECKVGDITVRLPEDSDVELDLGSTRGEIATAFPDVEQTRRRWSATAHGVLGTGTGVVRARNDSGRIAVLRREPAALDEPEPSP